MAYQAKKHKRFQEKFELVDANGDVAHSLNVDLDADDMIVKINRKYADCVRALSETTEMRRKARSGEDMAECFDKLGRAVVDLIETVFGTEDAGVILDFYENRYIELTKEVLPFITKVVIPRCIEIRDENKKSILRGYNRKQKRALRNMFKR